MKCFSAVFNGSGILWEMSSEDAVVRTLFFYRSGMFGGMSAVDFVVRTLFLCIQQCLISNMVALLYSLCLMFLLCCVKSFYPRYKITRTTLMSYVNQVQIEGF